MKLINAELRNKEHPNTFTIPDAFDREHLHPGDYAKIGIEGEPSGERFWVEVTHSLHANLYRGKLVNDLLTVPLDVGHEIIFGPEHVFDLMDNNETEEK